MAERKKLRTVDDIVNSYQEFHHKKGKPFKDRIKKFEEFHDPENIHAQQLALHAHYVIFGKPTDSKNFPGAYNEAYKVLDKHAKDDDDTIEHEDKLTEILESYTDTFLQNAMGKYKYKDVLARAEKGGKLNKEDLRKFKGILFGSYHADEEGKSLNILNEQYIKGLKGKKKIELIAELQGISEKVKEGYTSHLHQEAIKELITDEDRVDLADYIRPIFKERGWKHKEDHVLRQAEVQATHYGVLLHNAADQLRKFGYKAVKHEKKEAEK